MEAVLVPNESKTSGERELGRKPYRAPVLTTYGDLRALTTRTRADDGSIGDGDSIGDLGGIGPLGPVS